jgi:hypothetical protein
MSDDIQWRLAQLSEQQSAITNAMHAMLEGRWEGEDSVAAWLAALNPHYSGTEVTIQVPAYDEPIDNNAFDVEWIGSPNYWAGHGGYSVCGIVIHTMAGSLASCDSWFSRSASQVSSHFGIGLNGEQHQYVSLENSSWANGILEDGNKFPCGRGSPNWKTITIETEDKGNPRQEVTEAQYAATLAVASWAISRYPSIKYLLEHEDISPRSRPNCAGNRWAPHLGRLAAALGLVRV